MTIDYALQIARGETYIQTVDEIDYEREAKDVIFNAIRNGTLLKAQPMNMRDATEEERKSVKDYVDSVSKPTGVNFNELLRDCGTCKHNTGIDCGQYPCNECNRRTHPLYEPKIVQPTEAVSREQAKKFLYEEIERLHDDGLYDCFSRIIDDMYNELPSVTPSNEDIREAYIKGYDYGVKDWFKSKTQPSEDCISREEALLALTGMDLPTDRDKLIALFTERIQHLPSVTPQRPKGKWIEIEIDAGEFIYKCTKCGMRVINPYKYCPNCGAKMKGEQDNE